MFWSTIYYLKLFTCSYSSKSISIYMTFSYMMAQRNNDKTPLVKDFEQQRGLSQFPMGYPEDEPPIYSTTSSNLTNVVVSQPGNNHGAESYSVTVTKPPGTMLAIGLSCFVFWCCGCLFGLIAFIFASEFIFYDDDTYWSYTSCSKSTVKSGFSCIT